MLGIGAYIKWITYTCLFLGCFFLPFKTGLSNVGIIGIIITNCISLILYGSKLKQRIIPFISFSPLILFIPLIIGLVYSANFSQGLAEVYKYAFLGLLPFLGLRKDINIEKLKKTASEGLLIGAALSALFLIINNFYNFFLVEKEFLEILNINFTGENFTAPLDFHPIYLGLYYNMGLAILLFNNNISTSKSFKIITFALLVIAIVFLASRIVYFSSILLILLYLINSTAFKVFVSIITLLLIFIMLILPELDGTLIYKKTIDGVKWELSNQRKQDKNENLSDSRLARWKLGVSLIKDHPLLGVGTGQETVQLLKLYKKYNLKESIRKNYNIHNQFLSYAIKFGIIGTMALLIYFFRNIYYSFKFQNLLSLSFLMMVFWVFLVENVLDRNMGINFIAIFGTIMSMENFYLKHRDDSTSKI